MLTLYSFGPCFGVADLSPFVLKVDLYLRVTGIEFQNKSSIGNLQKAPKGKLPFIIDDGQQIADSHHILAYLQKKYPNALDQHLSEEQKASAYLMAKSLDENLYWCIVYSRWIRDDTWPIIKQAFFSNMPFPVKYIAPFVAQKGVKDALKKQGIGRHSNEEIMRLTHETLSSLSTLLSNKSYFYGEEITTFDIQAFAFLAELILVNLNNPMIEMARTFANLVAFCDRIQDQYYPELIDA